MINEELLQEDIYVGKNIVTEDSVSSMIKNSQTSVNETSSQGSSSKKNSATEITSMIENLTIKDDHSEKIPIETANIELLYQIIDFEENLDFKSESLQKNHDFVSSSDDQKEKRCSKDRKISLMVEKALQNGQSTFKLKIIEGDFHDLLKTSTGVSFFDEEKEKMCGKNGKKLLTTENALKNGRSICGIEMIKGNINNSLEISTGYYENESILDLPENNIYSWASRWDKIYPISPRYQLLREGLIPVHWDGSSIPIKTVSCNNYSKKCKPHRLYLNKADIYVENYTRRLESPIKYCNILNVYRIIEKTPKLKHTVEIEVPGGAYVLHMDNQCLQDQWYHSILWRKQIVKYRNIFRPTTDILTIMEELKNFVKFVCLTPIEDHDTHMIPIYMISKLLREIELQLVYDKELEEEYRESIIVSVSPLFKSYQPSLEMCEFFSKYFSKYPLSFPVQKVIYESVRRVLTHHMDDVKYPFLKKLLQEYINVLSYHDEANKAFELFVARSHGSNDNCPHPKVMNNLASSCIAAIVQWFTECNVPYKNLKIFEKEPIAPVKSYRCHLMVLRYMSEYNDWLPNLAAMLQPNSFPTQAFNCEHFIRTIGYILKKTLEDSRCRTHSQIFKLPPKQNEWFDVFCPTNGICQDNGQLWILMVHTVLNCCKKESFLSKLYHDQLDACMSLALKENNYPCQIALCFMLERNIVEENDRKIQIAATLQMTKSGRNLYTEICDKQQRVEGIRRHSAPGKALFSRFGDNRLAHSRKVASSTKISCKLLKEDY